jgi:CBS domain-containing membrane protein
VCRFEKVQPMTRLTLRAFGPAQSAPNRSQALWAAFGAMAGLLLTQAVLWGLGRLFGLADLGLLAHPLLMAPLGASAVLIYAVPSSPLAQPWSVVVGNSLAAILALLALQLGWLPVPTLGLAVFASLSVMAWARCLHPPGGAVALATVLAAPVGWQASLIWLVLTVFAGSVLLMAFGVVYHRALGRPYPYLP